MRIKAGKYTLALTMILSGILMLINTLYGHDLFQGLWMYSPIILILFGLEVIVLNLIYSHKENYTVYVSVGSIFLIIIVLMIFTYWTNKVEITGFEHFFDFKF